MVEVEVIELPLVAEAEGLESYDLHGAKVIILREEIERTSRAVESLTRKTDVFTTRSLTSLRIGFGGILRSMSFIMKDHKDWQKNIRGVQVGMSTLTSSMQLYDLASKALATTKWAQASAETAAGGSLAPIIAGAVIAGVSAVAGLAAAGVKTFAQGGSFLATQPTPVLVGEQGPELFTATPLGAGGIPPRFQLEQPAPISETRIEMNVTIVSDSPDNVGESFTNRKQLLLEAGRVEA